MTVRFEILGADRVLERTGDERTVFVDMTGEELLRPGDFDLSHWYPNATPPEWRADTSTEAALKFVRAHPDHRDLVVNDHADTDGVLSVFVMVRPEAALTHEAIVRGAAEVGDFGFWAEPEALVFYAWLAEVRARHRAARTGNELFAACIGEIEGYLSGAVTAGAHHVAAAGAVEKARDLIETGSAPRVLVHERLVAFRVPRGLAAAHLTAAAAMRVDGPLDVEPWLSHWARNAGDRERLHLVSVPVDDGWAHSLWVPQYLPWDTETLWRPAGLRYSGSRLTWQACWPSVAAAVVELSGRDGAAWRFRDVMAPWSEGFPVVVDHDRPSSLDPDAVAALIGPATEVDVVSAQPAR